MAPLLLYSRTPVTPHLPRDMMRSAQSRPSFQRAWRVFAARDGREIDGQLCLGHIPCCPGCDAVLEAQQRSRLNRKLPLDARAYDLDCRACRRFWTIVQHSERSLRLMRMRRFVAALRAVELGRVSPAPELSTLA